MKSFVQSTSNKYRVVKNIGDVSTVAKPLLPFDSTAPASVTLNRQINVSEPVYLFGGGYLSMTIPNIPITTSPRSMEAMVMYDTLPASNNGAVIGYGGTTASTEFLMVPRGNEITSHMGMHFNSANVDSGKSITDFGLGNWIHFCVTYDGTNQKVYLNGVLYATGALVINTGGPGVVNISRRPGDAEVTTGYIREARIWNKALTQSQVNDLVNTRLMYNPPGLIFYSRLNGATPATSSDIISNVTMTVNSTITSVSKSYNVNIRSGSFVL